MTQINRYLTNQRNHIAALRQQPLTGFTNQNGEIASWQDAAWRFVWPDGKLINFFFVDNTKQKISFGSNFSTEQILQEEQRHLLMAYAIELCAGTTSIRNLAFKHAVVRKLVSQLSDNIACGSNVQLNDAIEKVATNHLAEVYLASFFKWLISLNFIPPTLKISKKYKQNTRFGVDIIEHKINKIPETKILLALGAIFHDAIPPERERWNTHALTFQRDAFICSMTALAGAFPFTCWSMNYN